MARLLLDAHISGRVIATRLRRAGHDVRAINEERHLEGLADDEVLALAAEEQRILVTHDVKDFPPLLRSWAEAGKSHAGCVIIHGVGHAEFGRVLRGLNRVLAAHEEWTDVAVFLTAAMTDPSP